MLLGLTRVPRRLRYRRVLASMVFFQILPYLQLFVFTCTSFDGKKLVSMFPGAAKLPPASAQWLSSLHVQPVIQRACRCVVCFEHVSLLSNMPQLREAQKKTHSTTATPTQLQCKKMLCMFLFRFSPALSPGSPGRRNDPDWE